MLTCVPHRCSSTSLPSSLSEVGTSSVSCRRRRWQSNDHHSGLFVSACRTNVKWQHWSTAYHFCLILRTQRSLENNSRGTSELEEHLVLGKHLQPVCSPSLLDQSLTVVHINVQCVCDRRRRKTRLRFIQMRQLCESDCDDNRVARRQGWGMVMEVVLDIY